MASGGVNGLGASCAGDRVRRLVRSIGRVSGGRRNAPVVAREDGMRRVLVGAGIAVVLAGLAIYSQYCLYAWWDPLCW